MSSGWMVLPWVLGGCLLLFLGWVWSVRQVERQLPVHHTLARWYAHRGLWNETYPENSLAAFRQAWQHGYAIELDVRLSRDGAMVVFHDSDTRRMCGKSMKVHCTDLETLQGLTLLGTAERIPTLQQVLADVQGRVPLLIEVKAGPHHRKLCQQVVQLMTGTCNPWAVESFHPGIVRYFKRHAPQVMRGQLLPGTSRGKGFFQALGNRLLTSMVLNPLGKPHFLACTPDGLDRLPMQLLGQKRRLPVVVWTVRSLMEEQAAMRRGDGVIFEGYLPHP